MKRGNKAFNLRENTYHVEADVVPLFEFRQYMESGNYRAGVALVPDRGGRIENYPERLVEYWPSTPLHYENGNSKNTDTRRRYRGLVRILKKIRNEMENAGSSSAKAIPGYLLECMTWNVPNAAFAGSTWDTRVQAVLAHLWTIPRTMRTARPGARSTTSNTSFMPRSLGRERPHTPSSMRHGSSSGCVHREARAPPYHHVLGLGNLGLVACIRGSAGQLGILAAVRTVVAFLVAFGAAFEFLLWRWSWLHGWFVKRPDLRGTWRVELQSDWINPATNLGVPLIVCYMGVAQTLSTLQMHLMTPESESWFIAERISPSPNGVGYQVAGVYTNKPQTHCAGRAAKCIWAGCFSTRTARPTPRTR